MAVLISIQPKWVEKICKGEKTIEVRKTRPKLETPFKCFIYCTKDKLLHFWKNKKYSYVDDHSHNLFDKSLNGKVIGEFICDYTEESIPDYNPKLEKFFYNDFEDMGASCLSSEELTTYGKGKPLYGWHITNLKIYDEPKELSEFNGICNSCSPKCDYYIEHDYSNCSCGGNKPIKRPPQSWCYVECRYGK